MARRHKQSALFATSEDNNVSSDVVVNDSSTIQTESIEQLKSEISRLHVENQRLMQMNADLMIERDSLKKQLEQQNCKISENAQALTNFEIKQNTQTEVECKLKQQVLSIKDVNARSSINVPYTYMQNYGYKTWSREII